ncbi:MAG TPA: hypothetical protein VMA55_07810, partial [Acidovorax sp.]|nr:hypothetical protein [Acidovorax sp.]
MGVGTLKVGQRFDLDGQRHHITRLLGDQRIEFEQAGSGRRQELTVDQMLERYGHGTLIFRGLIDPQAEQRAHARVLSKQLLAQAKEKDRKLATLRLHFVTRLQGVPLTRDVLTPLIRGLWEKLKAPELALMPRCPHASTVARWIAQYRDADCNVAALLDQHANKGHRDRISQAVRDLMEDCVRDGYMTPERRNITSVVADINGFIDETNLNLIESEQLPHVSYEQVRNFISRLPDKEVYAARHGVRAAEVKYRTSGRGVAAALPLQRASMDHCKLDLFVVDEQTGLPLGRPWLTVILDECTRMILGYSLSFDEPSAMTVMRALRHALMPKMELEDVTSPWPCWGIMQTLVVDNGLEFHGQSLEFAAGQFGIIIQTCPRRQPWYKGKIERFFRTVQGDLIALIPGRSFSNVLERGDYDSSRHAAVSLETLHRLLNVWIADVYHAQAHSALQQSPLAKWDSLIDQVDRHLPESAVWLDAAFGKPGRRVLGHEGIQFDSLSYNSAEMGDLRARLGDRIPVDIITNDEDVGYLFVVCPETGEHLKVPAVDLQYANGMTRWQHTKCREYARVMQEKTPSKVRLVDAKRRIIELIKEDMLVNNRKSRQSQSRARSMADMPIVAVGEDLHGLSKRAPSKSRTGNRTAPAPVTKPATPF